jgi:hypothetical protein
MAYDFMAHLTSLRSTVTLILLLTLRFWRWRVGRVLRRAGSSRISLLRDAMTLLGTVGVPAAVGLAAASLLAIREARVDPGAVLRES